MDSDATCIAQALTFFLLPFSREWLLPPNTEWPAKHHVNDYLCISDANYLSFFAKVARGAESGNCTRES